MMHYILWPQCLASSIVKKVFVKTCTDKGPQISPKHNATASQAVGLCYTSTTCLYQWNQTLSTATRAISSTPLNMSYSRGGKQHTLHLHKQDQTCQGTIISQECA